MSSAEGNTLPDGWEEKTLSEVCDVRDGTHDSPKYIDKGFPLITSKNLKNGHLNFEKIKYISEADYNSINKRSKVDVGDILFAMIGTIGNPVLIKNQPNYAIKNVALFKKKSNDVLMTFLKYFLVNPIVIDKMTNEAKGATQKFVGLNYLRSFKITIPPLKEQKRIVAKIDTLFAKIDKAITLTEESLVQANNLLPSVLKEVFEKGKEDGWEEAKLGQVLRIERGGSPRPIKDYITEDENGLNWIKIGDATNSISDKYIYETKQRIKPEGLYKTRLVKEGDFILSNSMSFGKPYIMKTEGCIHDGWLSLKILDSSCLETDFLYYVLSSPIIYSKFRFLSSGTTVKNLNKAIVASVPISFPRLDEQKEIVSMLDGISNQSKETQYKLEEQLAYLKQLKSSILSKAFKGEL